VKVKLKLLKYKVPTVFSTFNVRTIAKARRQQELVNYSAKYDIDVICIQEHRIFHPRNEIKHTCIDNYLLVTASATKNSQRSTIGGVGVLLSPRASDNLLKVRRVSERILTAEFEGNPRITVIAAYSPTNCSEESNVDDFYNDLKRTTENVPAHNFLVIAGDFNGQIGHKDPVFTYNRPTNRNGRKLLDYAQEFGLMICNTKFMKPLNKLWTHQHPAGHRSQIDYIMTRRKWRNSIRDCRDFSSFSTVGSDHRMVSCITCLTVLGHLRNHPSQTL